MKYEKVSFNEKAILKYTVEQFRETNKHLWPGLTEEKRKQRLTEVYKLCELLAT